MAAQLMHGLTLIRFPEYFDRFTEYGINTWEKLLLASGEDLKAIFIPWDHCEKYFTPSLLRSYLALSPRLLAYQGLSQALFQSGNIDAILNRIEMHLSLLLRHTSCSSTNIERALLKIAQH